MEQTKVRMIALRDTYYGREIKAGEPFDVSSEHVVLLTKTKAARKADDEKRNYKRRDLVAEK